MCDYTNDIRLVQRWCSIKGFYYIILYRRVMYSNVSSVSFKEYVLSVENVAPDGDDPLDIILFWTLNMIYYNIGYMCITYN